MSLARLAAELRADDPDRFAMAMLAPEPARPRLLTLYALNGALACAPLASAEPLVAEIRLQWWADALARMAERAPAPHDLLTPLHEAWGAEAARLAPLAEARRRDAWRQSFETADEARDYVAKTAGALMAQAAAVVGLPEAVARAQGVGAGVAAWLRALPALEGLGLGLALHGDARRAALADLARAGQVGFATARAARRAVDRRAGAVLFAGAGAGATLAAVAQGDQPPAPSDFAARAARARLALTGRWWV